MIGVFRKQIDLLSVLPEGKKQWLYNCKLGNFIGEQEFPNNKNYSTKKPIALASGALSFIAAV